MTWIREDTVAAVVERVKVTHTQRVQADRLIVLPEACCY